MKKQNSAKGFKIIYFIISALWMVWWGALLYLVANTMEKRIFAFFVMLFPIPIYYILKGFFIGSKEIMKQPKYILIIVVLGIIAFVGWNKIDISTKDKELVIECILPNDPEKEYFMIQVSNGKMCFIPPSGNDSKPVCADVSIFNSDIVKTIDLDSKSSALVNAFFDEEMEIYVKLDRKTARLGFYHSNNDENVHPKNDTLNCRKKEKL